LRKVDENTKYEESVKELKDLRQSQANFFFRKNELDDDINFEKENENKKIIQESLGLEVDGDLLLKNLNTNLNTNKDKNKTLDKEKFGNKMSKEFIDVKNKDNYNDIDIDNLKENEEENMRLKAEIEKELKDEEENYIDSDDDSLEELFRKSYANLNELTNEVKY
jgi:hypothetical protein